MPLLETLSTLLDLSPTDVRPALTAERLEDALDVSLRGDPDNGNRYLHILRSFRVAAPIESVELRLPLRGATRKGPLCVIELAPSDPPHTELRDVARTFGEPSSTLAPRGRNARTTERFHVYDRPWGALRFGASASEGPEGARRSPVLTTIVIDIER